MKGKLGSDNGEVILSSFDEDVEVEEKKENEKRDRERWVLIKEAEMEIQVVNEAIGVRFNRGTRWDRRDTGIEIAGSNEGPSGCGFRRAIGSEEDEEDENRENGEKESGGFEEGDRECHAIPKTNQIKASLCD